LPIIMSRNSIVRPPKSAARACSVGSRSIRVNSVAFVTASGDAVVERRTRLLVQATRAAERASLLRQVEDSAKRQPLTAEELFCLVRLYEAEKDEDGAEERMLDLLTLERNNPEYLAHHIERLLQRGRKTEARSSIARLRKVEAESARVQAFAARLRMP
jgi:predicted Zn-dependent protease